MNQGPRWVQLKDKSKGQKYCATVPLNCRVCYQRIIQVVNAFVYKRISKAGACGRG